MYVKYEATQNKLSNKQRLHKQHYVHTSIQFKEWWTHEKFVQNRRKKEKWIKKRENPTTLPTERMRNKLIVVVCSLHIHMFGRIVRLAHGDIFRFRIIVNCKHNLVHKMHQIWLTGCVELVFVVAFGPPPSFLPSLGLARLAISNAREKWKYFRFVDFAIHLHIFNTFWLKATLLECGKNSERYASHTIMQRKNLNYSNTHSL